MGAPRRNRNAIKHGFYASRFRSGEVDLLAAKKTSTGGLYSELDAARVIAGRLFQRIDEGDQTIDQVALLNTFLAALDRIAMLTRSLALVENENPVIERAILDVLHELNETD